MTIILFIIILAVLILVHELGHFIVAKVSGIRVDEFGLGLPPRIWGKQYGETLYSINALPIGGFVKIFGEDPHNEEITEENKPRSMFYKPRWIQALVLVAGISFNILFAWFLISVGFIFGLSSPVGQNTFGEVKNPQVVIMSVLPNSPAQKAGLASGDTILSALVGGVPIKDLDSENVSQAITQSMRGDVTLTYRHGSGKAKTVVITPSEEIMKDKRAIGISMDNIGILQLPLVPAFLEGARTTYLLTMSTARGLANFIYESLIFKSDLSQVTGPIGIAGVVGQASQLGLTYLLSLIALISINLALINLVPFPALDGGRLLFVAIESIIRRPIHPKITTWANGIGFALLLLIMVIVSTHDIIRLL